MEIKKIGFSNIDIKNGFWKQKQDLVKNTTVYAVYDRFLETYRFEALKCTWKENDPYEPHFFWDSDVAKWIEGAAYILEKEKNEKIEKIIDDAVEEIVKNSDENGYFNSHYLVTEQDKRFCDRGKHELYCAGHLMEAAVAYYNATGKDKLLKAMCRYADYIEKVFKIEKSAKFITPGHPELELALVKLYEATGEERYFELAKYFIDVHGKKEDDQIWDGKELYNQDEMLIKDRTTADGHCVRALYLMCGAADVAKKCDDKELLDACERVFENIVNKRMYITGGVGSTYMGEAFTVDYDLPNKKAYAETCAAISLAMFAGRMQAINVNSKYADIVEKVIYNGFLSGMSMDGKAFFYENPLEIDLEFNDVNKSTPQQKERYPITQRIEVFECSCCPPNIVRFIPSIADYMYTYDSETLYVHQFMDSETHYEDMDIIQNTAFPEDGTVNIKCSIGNRKLAVRIPGWCRNFEINAPYKMENGYAIIENASNVCIRFDMGVTVMTANRKVHENAGKAAIMRGPVVYCAEGVDNGLDLKAVKIDVNNEFTVTDNEFLLPSLEVKAYRQKENEALYYVSDDEDEEIILKLIPYYAFANRGESDMCVWLLEK